MGCFKKSHWQPWISHLFTSHWAVYLEFSFTNVGNDFKHLFNSNGDQLQWRTVIF